MKNTRKNNITEENAAMAGYPMSAGGSDRDMSGRGSQIASPIVAGIPAVMAGIGKPGVPATMSASSGMAAAPKQSSSDESEEETEEVEEGGEDEAAVTDRVEIKVAKILENVDGNVKNYLDNVTESLVEKVDDYLDYVVEEWMTDNAVAVEQGVKTQIAENFISGLKNLFENHYIDVPAEKYNVLDELYASNRELETKLNEAVKYNMNLKKEVSLTECAGIFVAETRELADTQIVKLQNLMENVAFTSPEEYREKLVAIRENYLTRSRPISSRSIEPEQTFVPVKQTSTNLVENYAGALGRLNKKV